MSAQVTVTVGDVAPDFTLADQNGVDIEMASLRDRGHVLVVFYPFAFSGICTGELHEIRDDESGDFDADDVTTVALSCDPMFSLRGWADRDGFFFPLLSDFWPHGAVARAYGVFDEERGFATRGTFLVDTDGIVRWSLVAGPGERRDFAGYRQAIARLRG